jgi:hypothetical protein
MIQRCRPTPPIAMPSAFLSGSFRHVITSFRRLENVQVRAQAKWQELKSEPQNKDLQLQHGELEAEPERAFTE